MLSLWLLVRSGRGPLFSTIGQKCSLLMVGQSSVIIYDRTKMFASDGRAEFRWQTKWAILWREYNSFYSCDLNGMSDDQRLQLARPTADGLGYSRVGSRQGSSEGRIDGEHLVLIDLVGRPALMDRRT